MILWGKLTQLLYLSPEAQPRTAREGPLVLLLLLKKPERTSRCVEAVLAGEPRSRRVPTGGLDSASLF